MLGKKLGQKFKFKLTAGVLASLLLASLVVGFYYVRSVRPIDGSLLTRLDLLAYLWDLPINSLKIIFLLSFLCLASGAQIILNTTKVRLFWGILFFSLGMSLPHIVVSPPFEAPDEPDHFLGFISQLPKGPSLLKSAAILSKQGNLINIYNNEAAKFKPEDLIRRLPSAWADHMVPTIMFDRSPLTYSIWSLLAYLYDFESAQGLLLSIRLLHLAIFCLAISALVSVTAKLFARKEEALVLLCAIFLVPALPFFAMHVSNYAVVTSLYLIASTAIPIGLRITREKSPFNISLLSFLFGFLCCTPILGASSAISFFPVIILWSVSILYSKLTYNLKDFRLVMSFMTLGIIVFLLSALPNLSALPIPVSDLIRKVPNVFLSTRASLISTFLVIILILTCLLCAHRIGHENLSAGSKYWSQANNYSQYVVLGIGLVMLLVPILDPPGFHPNIEIAHQMTKTMYIRSSIKKYFLNYASIVSDFYLCTSFWLGFGWLEIPSQRSWLLWPKFLIPLALLSGSFAAIKNTISKATPSISHSSFLMLSSLIGTSCAIAMLASSYFDSSVNLHGRYLIGVSIVVIVNAAIYFTSTIKYLSGNFKFMCLLTVSAMKGFSLLFLLQRYFG